MDDALISHLEAALWAFLGKASDFCLNLLDAAGHKALELAAALAGWLDRLGAKLVAVPLWLSVPAAVALAALLVGYLLRQRLYDHVLVYYDVWLRRRGYARQVFTVRRGAVHREHVAMARRVPLPARFAAIAVYEAEPDRYAVAYGRTAGFVEDVRFYPRRTRAGLAAMGQDLIRHFRANVRMLYADGEVRALFALLDAHDPDFAACRPALPGETEKKAARGVSRTAPGAKRLDRSTA